MEDPFTEKLAWFKQNERPEVVLLISDDPRKINIMIAWTNTTIKRMKNILEPKDQNENTIWQWLWKNVKFDQRELRTKSAVSGPGFETQMQFLIGNRLIYPDGTMNSFVHRYLREKVLKLFEAKPTRTVKRKVE